MTSIFYDSGDESLVSANIPIFCRPKNRNSTFKNNNPHHVIYGLHRFGALTNFFVTKGLINQRDAKTYTLHADLIEETKISQLDGKIRGYTWYFENYLRAFLEFYLEVPLSDLTIGDMLQMLTERNIIGATSVDPLTHSALEFCKNKRNEYLHGRYERDRIASEKLQDLILVQMGFLRLSYVLYPIFLEKEFNISVFHQKKVVEGVIPSGNSDDIKIIRCNPEIFNSPLNEVRNTICLLTKKVETDTIYHNSIPEYKKVVEYFDKNIYDLSKTIKSLVRTVNVRFNSADYVLLLDSPFHHKDSSSLKLSLDNSEKIKINSVYPNSSAVYGKVLFEFIANQDYDALLLSPYAEECLRHLEDNELNNEGIELVANYINLASLDTDKLWSTFLTYPALVFFIQLPIAIEGSALRNLLVLFFSGNDKAGELLLYLGQTTDAEDKYFFKLFAAAQIVVQTQSNFREFVDLINEFPGYKQFLYFFNPSFSDLCFFDLKQESKLIVSKNIEGSKADRVKYLARELSKYYDLKQILYKLKEVLQAQFRFKSEVHYLQGFFEELTTSHPNYFHYTPNDTRLSFNSYEIALFETVSDETEEEQSFLERLSLYQFRNNSEVLAFSTLAARKIKKSRRLNKLTFYSKKLGGHVQINPDASNDNVKKMTCVILSDEFSLFSLTNRNKEFLHAMMRSGELFICLFENSKSKLDFRFTENYEVIEYNFSVKDEAELAMTLHKADSATKSKFTQYINRKYQPISSDLELDEDVNPETEGINPETMVLDVNKSSIQNEQDEKINFKKRLHLACQSNDETMLVPVFSGQNEYRIRIALEHMHYYLILNKEMVDLGHMNDYSDLNLFLYDTGILKDLNVVGKAQTGNYAFARSYNKTYFQSRDYFITDAFNSLSIGDSFIGIKVPNRLRSRQDRYMALNLVDKHSINAEFDYVSEVNEEYAIIALKADGRSYFGRIKIEDYHYCKKEQGEKYILFDSPDTERNRMHKDAILLRSGQTYMEDEFTLKADYE